MKQRPHNIFIVVLNWNNYSDTVETIESLFKADLLSSKILLVDNGSDDGSGSKLKEKYRDHPNMRVMIREENSGFVGGNNAGIDIALSEGADWIMLLNNDVEVDPGFLKEMIEVADPDPKIGMLAPLIYYYDKKDELWSSAGGFDRLTASIRIRNKNGSRAGDGKPLLGTEFISGCCMLIRSSLIRDVGLLDGDYYFYCEDADLCFRALAKGYKLSIVTGSRIWHKIARGFGGADRPDYMYYQIRNRLLLVKKNFSAAYYIYALFVTVITYVPYRITGMIIRGSGAASVLGCLKAAARALFDVNAKKYGKAEV